MRSIEGKSSPPGPAYSAPAFCHAAVIAQGAPVKIGVILYLSGVQAFMGQQTRKGNEFGGTYAKENGGPPMEFIYGDAESKPENGRVVAERLIRDGCTLLIGTNDSGSTISVAQAAEAAKIPFLINIASAPQITEQGFTQIFRNFPPATTLVGNAVVRIKELGATTGVEPKTAVILHVNDTFGQGIMKGVDIVWEKVQVPIKIVDRISYDVHARDLSVEVAKAKADWGRFADADHARQRRDPDHSRNGEAELVADGDHKSRKPGALREGFHRRARKIW